MIIEEKSKKLLCLICSFPMEINQEKKMWNALRTKQIEGV